MKTIVNVAMMLIATLTTVSAYAQTVVVELTEEECAAINMRCTPSPAPAPTDATEAVKQEPIMELATEAVVQVDDKDEDQISQPEVTKKTSKVKRWRKVGGDPCNPKADCTLENSLAKAREESGWSTEVTAALLTAVKNGTPERGQICSGWRGWMTWGKHSFKFHPNTVADWGEGVCEPVQLWKHRSGELMYNLIKVGVCGNWGGWTETVSAEAEAQPTQQKAGGRVFGRPYLIECPEPRQGR